jgi:hypothetical protein
MKCYNPLYRLFDVLNQVETTGDLIGMVEQSFSVDDFKCLIGKRIQAGMYPMVCTPDLILNALDAATSFAAWWQYK